MNFGANVRKIRKDAGLSQKQLASEIGITQAMLNQVERGFKIPSLVVCLDIAKVLNTTVDELAKGA